MLQPDRTAIMFMTHLWDGAIGYRFERIWRECGGIHPVRLLLQDDQGPVRAAWLAHLDAIGARQALWTFEPEALRARLGHPWVRSSITPGCAHYPLMDFVRGDDAHDHYWLIEGDADYSGRWTDLFAAFAACDADLAASHVRPYADQPEWFWWRTMRTPAGPMSLTELRASGYRAFLPICRVSARAMRLVDAVQAEGWAGHAECLIPTVLRLRGASVVDLRDIAPCYAVVEQYPMPTPDDRQYTIRWRPEVSLDEFVRRGGQPLLFHPVKQAWAYDGQGSVVLTARDAAAKQGMPAQSTARAG